MCIVQVRCVYRSRCAVSIAQGVHCVLYRVCNSNFTPLVLFGQQGPVDVGDNPSARDGGLDKGIQLLVPRDGQLEVPRSDPLGFQVLFRVLSSQKYS